MTRTGRVICHTIGITYNVICTDDQLIVTILRHHFSFPILLISRGVECNRRGCLYAKLLCVSYNCSCKNETFSPLLELKQCLCDHVYLIPLPPLPKLLAMQNHFLNLTETTTLNGEEGAVYFIGEMCYWQCIFVRKAVFSRNVSQQFFNWL